MKLIENQLLLLLNENVEKSHEMRCNSDSKIKFNRIKFFEKFKRIFRKL